MAEPIFFKRNAGLTVGEIVALTGAVPHDGARLDRRVVDVAPLDRAGPGDLIFFDKAKFAADLATTHG